MVEDDGAAAARLVRRSPAYPRPSSTERSDTWILEVREPSLTDILDSVGPPEVEVT